MKLESGFSQNPPKVNRTGSMGARYPLPAAQLVIRINHLADACRLQVQLVKYVRTAQLKIVDTGFHGSAICSEGIIVSNKEF